MVKYMKKGKIIGDVSVMEVPQSVLGVRTRAKTLALQQNSEFSYLQLRNRRLEKPQFPLPPSPSKPERPEKSKHCSRGGGGLRIGTVNSGPASSTSFSVSKKMEVDEGELDVEDFAGKLGSRSTTPLEREKTGEIGMEVDDDDVEASFGENNLEYDATGRGTRESTPSSFMRELPSIRTPRSADRLTWSGSAIRRQSQNPRERIFSPANELDTFFANAEMQHQKQFTDKYNFDIVNDLPLPGRYDWVRV